MAVVQKYLQTVSFAHKQHKNYCCKNVTLKVKCKESKTEKICGIKYLVCLLVCIFVMLN